jgi:Protein of unknown function (DUF550)
MLDACGTELPLLTTLWKMNLMSELGSTTHLGELLTALAQDQSDWSQATFGTDRERGPLGALRHLEKEARETQDAPNDVEEYADCFLLILDAARRAGISPQQLIEAAQHKMVVNRQRTWPRPVDDQPVEHVR